MARRKIPMEERKQQPAFVPTERDRELVAILVANGITVRAAAQFVIHPLTGKAVGEMVLHRYFKDEIANAREHEKAKLLKTAFSIAHEAKNPTMTIFLLKSRLGFKEPAQDVNLHQTYGELVEQATKPKEPPALAVVQGGKT